MDAVESGSHAKFWEQVEGTGNTVCGRHPIGVVLATLEVLNEKEEGMMDGEGLGKGKFRFLRYERSELVRTVKDSSVSYCSAFAIL